MNVFYSRGSAAVRRSSSLVHWIIFETYAQSHATITNAKHDTGLFNKRHGVQGLALWTNEKLAWMWCGWTSKTFANCWSCVQLLFCMRPSWSSGWVLLFQCRHTRPLETSRPQSPPRPVSESPGTQPQELWRATKWPFTPLGMMLTWGNCRLAPMIAPSF